jgi:hypothetical protein
VEVGLGLVRASAIFAVRDRVVNTVHLIVSMQAIPAARFVGMNNSARFDVLADELRAVGFFGDHGNQGSSAPFTCHDNGLVLGRYLKPAINPIGFAVLLADVTGDICAINFHNARPLALILNGADCFTDLSRCNYMGSPLIYRRLAQNVTAP